MEKKIKRRRLKESVSRALGQDRVNTDIKKQVLITVLIFPLWNEKKYK